MLPPEVLRIVLLIGLAATGYMMILAWNDDRNESRAPVGYAESPVVDTTVSNDVQITPASETGDIPDISLVAGAESVPMLVAEDQVSTVDRLVKVTTPKHWMWIDLLGGDIVRVQLPEHPVALEQLDVPFKLLEKENTRLYVAQSGLVGPNGTDGQSRPQFSSDVAELDVTSGERTLTLRLATASGEVRKIFTFRADDYLVDMRYEVDNDTSTALNAALYAQIKRDNLEPATEESFSLGPQPYLGGAFTTVEENYLKIEFEDVDEDGPFDATVAGGWVAFSQHYFMSAWVAPVETNNRYYARRGNDGRYLFGFTSPMKNIVPSTTGVWHSHFYAGPKDQKRLEEISPHLNLTIDYGFLWWIATPLFTLLDFLHGVVGNWGLAIISLTIIVKAVLYPLSAAGYRSMANMRRVAPAMKKLQERYKNDREKLSREMMGLYKKEGANPLGGCLPMLLPMPIFIALYWVLFESVELRQAPFFLWIEDLAQMDPYFILPLLMGASTYWMQSLSPQMGDPMQQKMMKMMPIMFTILFLFFPAGLVLYWLVNNLLSIAQQQYVYRKADRAAAAAS